MTHPEERDPTIAQPTPEQSLAVGAPLVANAIENAEDQALKDKLTNQLDTVLHTVGLGVHVIPDEAAPKLGAQTDRTREEVLSDLGLKSSATGNIVAHRGKRKKIQILPISDKDAS